jgi:hypothetical protein
MNATIWTHPLTLPAGFCYNCGATADTSVVIASQSGLASTVGPWHGPVVAVLASAAAATAPRYTISYCTRCAKTAHKKAPELLAPVIGLLLVGAGFGLITWFTEGAARIVSGLVAVAGFAGTWAWWRYMQRPVSPGQTTRWRAFAVLNSGKDLLSGLPFTRIEYSNPRVWDELLRLNPGVEVTRQDR